MAATNAAPQLADVVVPGFWAITWYHQFRVWLEPFLERPSTRRNLLIAYEAVATPFARLDRAADPLTGAIIPISDSGGDVAPQRDERAVELEELRRLMVLANIGHAISRLEQQKFEVAEFAEWVAAARRGLKIAMDFLRRDLPGPAEHPRQALPNHPKPSGEDAPWGTKKGVKTRGNFLEVKGASERGT